MNRGAISVIYLALSAVVLIGLYSVYTPQINTAADTAFNHVNRFVGSAHWNANGENDDDKADKANVHTNNPKVDGSINNLINSLHQKKFPNVYFAGMLPHEYRQNLSASQLAQATSDALASANNGLNGNAPFGLSDIEFYPQGAQSPIDMNKTVPRGGGITVDAAAIYNCHGPIEPVHNYNGMNGVTAIGYKNDGF